jgi:para-aminobenzoate synthetase component I
VSEYKFFPVSDLNKIKIQMLNWCSQFNIFCFLDNHQYQQQHHSIECILAVGSRAQIQSTPGKSALEALSVFIEKHQGRWIFGHLSYDLKNEIEGLRSTQPDYIGFPDLFFFLPEIILELSASELRISTAEGDAREIFDAIVGTEDTVSKEKRGLNIQSRFSRKEYIETVKQLQQHILRGDCYEINFCQEFFDDNANIKALDLFFALSEASPNPFSAYYRVNDRYLVCASPERFLKKTGNTIYSQPIKGTAKRSISNPIQDEEAKNKLQQSKKERSENVMVVDLVRNDLSRFCEQGSVEVEELFAIYSFPQVHQMISTVKGKLEEGVDPINMIRSCFPMGSMTGAPKRRVMQLIDQYEKSGRGLFSGSVGYFDPAGDFDFNVVIRSILFNNSNKYLSFQTGSAITFYSDPEHEYEECMLKAAAIKKVLE